MWTFIHSCTCVCVMMWAYLQVCGDCFTQPISCMNCPLFSIDCIITSEMLKHCGVSVSETYMCVQDIKVLCRCGFATTEHELTRLALSLVLYAFEAVLPVFHSFPSWSICAY